MINRVRPALLASIALAVGLTGIVQISADNPADYVARVEPVLKSVPALELPAKSASLVAAARPTQKQPVASAIIQVVSRVNPSALPPVVGAISRTEPSVSSSIVAEASKLQPKLTSSIQLASMSSTPTPTVTSVAGTTAPDPTNDNGKKKGHYKNGVPP